MLKECIRCFGKGEVLLLGNRIPCPVCKRLGKLDVPDGMDICQRCNGSGGTYTAIGKDPCVVCGGSGFVPSKEEDA